MSSDSRHPDMIRFKRSLYIPLLFVFILVFIKVVEILSGVSFSFLGVRPRTLEGLDGILTMPLIHGDFKHLINNAGPLIALGTAIFFFYRKVAFRVISIVWILGGISVWLLARGNVHIGASGLVFGFAAFLILSGFLRSDVRSLALALVIVFFYGGMIWGILPGQVGVSWEGHLFGALAGVLAAVLYKDVDPLVKRDPWTDEESDPEKRKYEVWNE